MASITSEEINQKLKFLPSHLLQEVNDFIEFLNFKSSKSDWSEQLTDEQILSIKKGKKDIDSNKIISHKEAKDKIKNYIKNKTL